MDFFNERTFIAILIIVMVTLALGGCAPKHLPDQGPKQPTVMDTISKADSIGLMIGCMFAPNSPECDKIRHKKTDVQETNKERDSMEETKSSRQE